MTRRSTTRRPAERRRRSPLVVLVVVIAALALALAVTLLPGAMVAPAPLNCPYGEVILNGVHQCLPPRAS